MKEKEREHERRKRHREEQDKARREWERQKRREMAREHSRRERWASPASGPSAVGGGLGERGTVPRRQGLGGARPEPESWSWCSRG